jgi:hypothetical protein
MILMLCVGLAFQNLPAITVQPGDPIIDLEVGTLDAETVPLNRVVSSSFCFFVRRSCTACLEAIAVIEAELEDHHVVLIFIEETGTETWLRDQQFDADLYLVDEKELERFNMVRLPALLAYREDRLTFAFHGPITKESCRKMKYYFDQ